MEEDENVKEDKKIVIQGQNNRYQIKKLVAEKKAPALRKGLKDPPAPLIDINKQLKEAQIERKLVSYKAQDKKHEGRYDEQAFVTPEDVRLLMDQSTACHYCKQPTQLFYEYVREKRQWTLDRINNDLGHVKGNVTIACLECNLQRKRTGYDAFLFTKTLKVVRSEN
jgi:NACalpha-BTF3-like transcription factor